MKTDESWGPNNVLPLPCPCPAQVRSDPISACRHFFSLSVHASLVRCLAQALLRAKGPGEKEEMNNNTEERLNEIMTELGKKYNYDSVNAQFVQFTDFKMKWRRSYRWIEFDVSDYLLKVPENILKGIAEYTFRKITGKDAEYSNEVVNYLVSDEFVDTVQSTYINRCRWISEGSEGNNRNLTDAYRRLVNMELIEEDQKIVLRWDEAPSWNLGKSSVLMRTVQINRKLDDPTISETAFDYAVYTRLAHIQAGFSNQGPIRKEIYEQMLDRYPERNQAQEELEKKGFRL